MTQYTTLIEIDSSLTIVVSGEKMPPVDCYNRGKFYDWLKAASKYPIANDENKKMFLDFIGGYKHKTNEFNLTTGIEIKPENVKLFVAQDGPKKGTTIAYFVPPIPEVVEEETQDELYKKMLHEHAINGVAGALKQFQITRIKPNIK